MEMHEIIKYLKNVKRTGENKYTACCPAHDDQHPSLSVYLSDDGARIMLHCFVGCTEDEILKSIGLKKRDLYTSKAELIKNIGLKPDRQYEYRYLNEDGSLAYLKVRNEYPDRSKKFTFEQPNGKRNLQGAHRVPYNLPNVLNSSKVYFVEGEKCANILIENGLTATTLDTGANSVWQDNYDVYFNDKEIIVIPDNDEAGLKYAEKILNHISTANVLILPNLKEKEDVYDWIKSGHTIQELNDLPQLTKDEFISKYFKEKTRKKTKDNYEKETESQIIIKLVKQNDALLFHDTANNVYAAITVDGHKEVWSLESKDFSMWLNGLYYNSLGKPPRKDGISQAVAVLSAEARFGNKEAIPLSNRVAKIDNTFWYSLSNSKWQAVKITEDGWSVEDNPPILFNRFRHQIAQVEPKSNGNIYKIFDYINIKDNRTLFLCWLVSCFVSEIPHAMPIFFGEKGAAKSTSCMLLKKLIDPSALETLTIQNNVRSMAVNLQQHWFLPFDNVSQISEEISDTLCRAITGGGIQQRKLFSDADDYIFTFKRCIALNGINNVATRPDLLDRAILVELSRISENNRRELSEILKNFDNDLPLILGSVFDILSKAMKIYPTVKLEKLPRMADFARWGYAIGEALGNLGQVFLDEYRINYDRQNIEAINSDVVAVLMIDFMKDRENWTGRVSDLWNQLAMLAPNLGIKTNIKAFPAQPNTLSRRLNGLRSNLELVGISFTTESKSDATYITINNEKISKLPPYQIVFDNKNKSKIFENVQVSSDKEDDDTDIVEF